jgi:hypothetical protein
MNLPLGHLLVQMMRQQRLTHGLRSRQSRNARLRASGTEPFPHPVYGGIKRMARFLRRQGVAPVPIKNPRDYMNSPQRRAFDHDQSV